MLGVALTILVSLLSLRDTKPLQVAITYFCPLSSFPWCSLLVQRGGVLCRLVVCGHKPIGHSKPRKPSL